MSNFEKALLLTLFALAAAYLLVMGAPRAPLLLGHAALILAPVLAAICTGVAARRGARGAVATWWLLSIAASGVATAQIIWAFRQLVLQQTMSFPSLSYVLFLAFHPLFALAVLTSLREGERTESRAVLTQDALLACAAIALALLRFVFEPLRDARPWLTYTELAWIIGGQFLAQLSLVAAAMLVVWRRSVLAPRAATAIVIVALVNGGANLLQVAGIDPDPGSPGDLFDLAWIAGWLTLTAAGAAGATANASAWTGRTALSLSGRLRQGIAPVVGLVMTATVIDVAVSGNASIETATALAVTGILLAVRLTGTLGAADREQKKQHELARTRVLVELSRTLATALRVEDALAHVAGSAMKLLNARRIWVERPQPDGALRVIAAQPHATATLLPAERSCSQWLGGERVAQRLTGQGLETCGPDGLPLPGRGWVGVAEIRFGDRNAGVLAAERSDRGFDDAELQLLGALADQAAVAIENARLVEEAREAERTRLRSEKLASLGQLAAGVAHEINNPLAAIHTAAELLAAEDTRDEHSESVDIIRTQAARAAGIVRGMLDFVRPAELTVVPLQLEQVVQDVVRSRAAEHAAQGIRVETQLAHLPAVLAAGAPLEQVFLNLMVNAEHALACTTGERVLRISGERAEDEVLVYVQDTGTGIPPEHLGRVFDPFFTTKPVGQGTGLGLSVSYGILRQLGGTINVQSTPGVGTTFTLRLPCVEGAAEPAEQIIAAPRPPTPAQRFTVLLVDDEASIRHLVSRFLRRRGHVVETAENGRDALRLLSGRDFDVILTDLKMPVLSGEAFYARLREMDAGLASRVLFMSGDTVADSTREFLLRTAQPFIGKPFDLQILAESVAEVALGARQTVA